MTQDLFGTTLPELAQTAQESTKPGHGRSVEKPPLAERMRPKTIDEVIGQKHLLGPGMPLRTAFESGHPHSMILWGPPGVGKTTLARLMANAFNLPFISISAVLSGVKEIRELLLKMKEENKLILLASHNREDIQVLCDEVYEMEGGVIRKL